ncbi:MAG: glycosyltransferase [Candidatus Omnitrophota bacterium]|jgi:glycosyltransferase involved in cell wall biosynthesis
MKVAFYVYPTAFQNPGGGEIQLLKTKQSLEKLGVTVKLFDTWQDKLENFDILHAFGSVKDALPMMQAAHRVGVKNVLSTICWYNWRSAWASYGSWQRRLAAVGRHAAKVFFPFVSSDRKRMMDVADILMPNSQSEAEQLRRFFLTDPKKIRVIPNAVDPVFLDANPDLFVQKYGFRDFVLCVGRIEPRKNQLGMIRALNGTKVTFVLVGDPVKNYPEYYQACRKATGSNIHFLGNIPHDSELLRSAYAACDTFLLASWLETPGLAALEAALAGAKIVITQDGAAREYFKDMALYVAPQSIRQIRKKALASQQLPKTGRLKKYIASNYLWESTGARTLAVYKELLGG